MKLDISIPDDLFEDAEQLARRLRASRSQLYARALAEFVARDDDEHVTVSMDAVVAEMREEIDDFTRKAAQRALRRVEW